MVKPVISIIMPAYNAEQYINDAIQSVINQSHSNWELIVINDGSTDSTASIIATFEDKRIKYIEQENAGVSAARNAGLDIAKGKYITFLDADDILPLNSLQDRFEYLESNLDVNIVDGIIQVKNENMEEVLRTYSPYYQGDLLPRLVTLDSRVFFNVCYFFKMELLGKVRFKEGMTHAEDLLFYIELSHKKNAFYGYVESDVYFYRSGNDSAMLNLDGLEKGYFQLINNIKKFSKVSNKQHLYLRLKIAKILFLSHFRNKDFIRSFACVFKAFNVFG